VLDWLRDPANAFGLTGGGIGAIVSGLFCLYQPAWMWRSLTVIAVKSGVWTEAGYHRYVRNWGIAIVLAGCAMVATGEYFQRHDHPRLRQSASRLVEICQSDHPEMDGSLRKGSDL
jgi:hypothetical protein